MTTTPKKSKATRPDFTDARRACRTPAEQEQLAKVIAAGWTSAELHEYSRLFFFKNHRDYPTPVSYRRALSDIAGSYSNARICESATLWRKKFRKGGSKPRPPRREGLLIRARGQSPRIESYEYSWPDHTEEYRSMIEQRARDYFKISPEQPLHVNCWAASQRWYWREQQAEADAVAKALAATKPPKAPKKPSKKPSKPPYKKLAPQFSRDWPGHTDAFRQEVDQRVRDDRRLPHGAYVGPSWWKIACNKYYELTDACPAK